MIYSIIKNIKFNSPQPQLKHIVKLWKKNSSAEDMATTGIKKLNKKIKSCRVCSLFRYILKVQLKDEKLKTLTGFILIHMKKKNILSFTDKSYNAMKVAALSEERKL